MATKSTHETAKVAFIVIGVLFLFWLYKHRQYQNAAPEVTPPESASDPETLTYAANPNQFDPASINANINIGNQGLGYLDNKYMPMFGFVGMANGVFYQ